ncbi:MAG: hypothetical protein O3A20_02620 [Planctomycetota bacterium]|nr:hypothetical protein [Planctomycetota bacterium]
MTEIRDWLSDALDRHPGEKVPDDFAIRLMSRIHAETPRTGVHKWPLRMAIAAGALVILGLGYWLGMGTPNLRKPVLVGTPGDTAALEVEEMWRNRDLLESWELLNDPDLQLGLAEAMTGAGIFESVPASPEAPR